MRKIQEIITLIRPEVKSRLIKTEAKNTMILKSEAKNTTAITSVNYKEQDTFCLITPLGLGREIRVKVKRESPSIFRPTENFLVRSYNGG